MKLGYVGVDLAKNVFQLHGVDRHGQAVWRRRLRRGQWLQALLDTIEPGCVIGMEACTGAHHWARQLRAEGFEVRLIAPQFVKPYVKSNKNDRNDAEAICEALMRPNMRFVAVKTIAQQDIQAMQRVRAELMKHRNAKVGQIRGLMAEYGLVAPQTVGTLRAAIPAWLEDADNGLSGRFRCLLHGLWEDLQHLDQRLRELDQEIRAIADQDPVAKRLQQLRGVGPLVATALGLTPRQHSSGDKHRLLGITKRGDAYLRTLMIHGARAVVSQAWHRDDPLSHWVTNIAQRSHTNVAAVALANKTARIAWAMLRQETNYNPQLAVA